MPADRQYNNPSGGISSGIARKGPAKPYPTPSPTNTDNSGGKSVSPNGFVISASNAIAAQVTSVPQLSHVAKPKQTGRVQPRSRCYFDNAEENACPWDLEKQVRGTNVEMKTGILPRTAHAPSHGQSSVSCLVAQPVLPQTSVTAPYELPAPVSGTTGNDSYDSPFASHDDTESDVDISSFSPEKLAFYLGMNQLLKIYLEAYNAMLTNPAAQQRT